jgi:hypothetical protein
VPLCAWHCSALHSRIASRSCRQPGATGASPRAQVMLLLHVASAPETVPEFGGHAEHSHDARHYHFYTPAGMAPVDGPAFLREAAQLAGPGSGGASVALFLKGSSAPPPSGWLRWALLGAAGCWAL